MPKIVKCFALIATAARVIYNSKRLPCNSGRRFIFPCPLSLIVQYLQAAFSRFKRPTSDKRQNAVLEYSEKPQDIVFYSKKNAHIQDMSVSRYSPSRKIRILHHSVKSLPYVVLAFSECFSALRSLQNRNRYRMESLAIPFLFRFVLRTAGRPASDKHITRIIHFPCSFVIFRALFSSFGPLD